MVSPLTMGQITQHAQKILEKELEMRQVFSLVEVHCVGGDVLGPIMVEMGPYEVHAIARELGDRPAITLANENESILVMSNQVKHLKVLRVTSKE